jgi:hypothetical protein
MNGPFFLLTISWFTISNSLVALSSGFMKHRIPICRFGFPVVILPNSLDCCHAPSRDERTWFYLESLWLQIPDASFWWDDIN